ncbi:MAG TPA: hypothetical protein VGS19_01845 [Streptosporangiaceae bacterium]|nr:hypothetical protein [Streptosporangiaceae bacterium]
MTHSKTARQAALSAAGLSHERLCLTFGGDLARVFFLDDEDMDLVRHRHLGTLGIYVQLGEETSARITAENDDHNRRRHR